MFMVSLCTSLVMPVGLVPPAAAGNPRLQALLDELVANGAGGVVARVDDGIHSWRLASGAARLEPPQHAQADAEAGRADGAQLAG
jgi:D-alanyl-D-alanine carboxypeptidase